MPLLGRRGGGPLRLEGVVGAVGDGAAMWDLKYVSENKQHAIFEHFNTNSELKSIHNKVLINLTTIPVKVHTTTASPPAALS